MTEKPPIDGNPANLLLWLDWLGARTVHRWIHAGFHFVSGTWGSLDGSLNFLFDGGASFEANWFHQIFCEGAIQVQVYQDPTIGVGSLGTALAAFNSKRPSGTVPTGTLYVNPGIEDIGTRIPYGMMSGGTGVGGASTGGAASQREEIIADMTGSGRRYIISLATESALDYEYHIDWYEET